MACLDTWALVPVKRFSQAKRRLSDVLSAAEREKLAQTMLIDVLKSLRATTSLAGFAVVSGDPEALAIGKKFGAAMIFDPAEAGLNNAVQLGLDALAPYGCRVLVVPADIPFAKPSEFESIVELLDYAPLVLTPALSDGGTNALAMRSPGLVPPQFGENSFRSHRDFARRQQLCCSVLRSEGIGRDIDRVSDFGPHLMSSEDDGSTPSFLRELNLAGRMGMTNAPLQ